MERVIALSIRAGLSLIIGFVIGAFFLIATPLIGTLMFNPPISPPMWFLSLSVGLGCGLAAFLCFFKPESDHKINGITLLISSTTGLLGGYIGTFLSNPEGVRNQRMVASSLTSPDVAPFVYMGVLLATVATGTWYAYRHWTYNED